MNEMTLSSLIQIMQDGFIQHDKQESAGRFLLESVTIQEDSLCTTDLNSKKISRLVSRKDPVPDDIKQAALRNDIAVKVEEYFRQKVMSDINPYTKDDVLQKLMNIIIQDAEVAQRKKNEFQRLYDAEDDAYFLYSVFMYVLQRNNKIIANAVEYQDAPLLAEVNYECPITHEKLVEEVKGMRLNSLRKEMTEGKKSFKRSYSDLERFFPGMEFKSIAEIDKFHQGLSKVLQEEFKESEADLATTYVMLGSEIKKIKEQIAEIKNIPNVTQAVLKEYARITTELNNLKAANENYTTFGQLKKTAKEYAETRDRIIASQLSDIQDIVNDKMKEITVKIVRDKNLIPPRLNLEKINSYTFETKGDDGSGAGQRGLITFDLANMAVSNIPFVVHDADLMDPIEKPTLTALIRYYDSIKEQKKQAFVSFRSYEFYAEEIRTTIEKCKVIELESGGYELFGWAWNKENQNEQGE